MIIERKRLATCVKCTEEQKNLLERTFLRGCPFRGFSAWDLLKDLIMMHDYKLSLDVEYSISDFLTICNDAHAELYRDIFEDV